MYPYTTGRNLCSKMVQIYVLRVVGDVVQTYVRVLVQIYVCFCTYIRT
jgi:hypothetical protein